MIFLFKLASFMLMALVPQQEPLGEFWGTGEEEAKYYRLVDVPLPQELAVEAGSFEVMPDENQLAIATRRGDILLVDGAFDRYPEPRIRKFASGLDEIFGMAYRDGAFIITQQTEVTRITDTDHDGLADRFDTLSDAWGFRNYHEFAFGSKPDPEGNVWVALCLSESYNSKVPFRGWCLKITPEGKTIPVCSGIRSPCGIGPNEHGVMFYAESQGPWNGSCSLKVLEQGGFMGHPISYNWYELAPEMGPPPIEPNSPSRLEIERQRVKELVPYAVVFPYKRMGRSISGFMVDRTNGKFGPFENQIFIGDFSLGIVMRATTEKVNGVWQGACYPFREGFDTGLLAVQFTPNGSLIAGGTNRGWPVRGAKAYAVQRLDWTGVVPFEIREIRVSPSGFHLSFTKPVDRELAARPETYQLKTFTHIYQQGYGSPEVDQTTPQVSRAIVSDDGLSVEIVVEDRVQGHVHDFYLPDMRSTEGERLLHASAYYTLNEIPKETERETSASNKPVVTTRGVIDFQRPDDAVQWVGESESLLIPESDAACQWTFDNGVLTASPTWDSVITPKAYQDFRMHLEFNLNDAGDVPRERSGNSGIYIQQRYELQILNSFGVAPEDYRLDDCACLYGFKRPDQLVCRQPGEWQTFDIAFRAARYIAGEKVSHARITVYHNGVLVHDDVELTRKTGAGKKEDPYPRPIKLQGHHNQVQFRNMWVQELPTQDPSVPTLAGSEKSLPLPGEAFQLNGHDAFVMLPPEVAPDMPWVWYAPTLPRYPAQEERWMFQRFLDAGIAVAGIDVGESYGSPQGTHLFREFYDYLVIARQFSKRPVLLARSRGGLMHYNWAIENPQSVAGIAGIYPVCNLASYPGLDRACTAYGLTADQLAEDLSKYNPIGRIEPLANAGVPIFHIHGDQDKVVPLTANSQPLEERYRDLGGNMILEVVEGQGHNMWSGWFESERLVEFVLAHARPAFARHPVPEDNRWLTFPGGEGPGQGKHIVLIAAEQEYRSEQAFPMLAKILSQRHGFHCTVLFSVNEQGEVDPTLPAPFKDESRRHHIPGLEYLDRADAIIWMSRYMQLTDEQAEHFHRYFDSGKPIIALRTANHGFWGGKPYTKDDQKVSLRDLLGGSFMEHHGGWHQESTRGIIVPEKQQHPILTGVDDIWGPSDVYRCHNEQNPVPEDCEVLVMGQPQRDLTPQSEPNREKEPLPIAWTKTWVGNNDLPTRIFHLTMGSARDFENAGVRRLTLNAVYWGMGLEDKIHKDLSVEIVGDYQPLRSGFDYEAIGVTPRKPSSFK